MTKISKEELHPTIKSGTGRRVCKCVGGHIEMAILEADDA